MGVERKSGVGCGAVASAAADAKYPSMSHLPADDASAAIGLARTPQSSTSNLFTRRVSATSAAILFVFFAKSSRMEHFDTLHPFQDVNAHVMPLPMTPMHVSRRWSPSCIHDFCTI
jgi:hypothetical protein